MVSRSPWKSLFSFSLLFLFSGYYFFFFSLLFSLSFFFVCFRVVKKLSKSNYCHLGLSVHVEYNERRKKTRIERKEKKRRKERKWRRTFIRVSLKGGERREKNIRRAYSLLLKLHFDSSLPVTMPRRFNRLPQPASRSYTRWILPFLLVTSAYSEVIPLFLLFSSSFFFSFHLFSLILHVSSHLFVFPVLFTLFCFLYSLDSVQKVRQIFVFVLKRYFTIEKKFFLRLKKYFFTICKNIFLLFQKNSTNCYY